MNAFSFLPMNINGDDKTVYPYTSSSGIHNTDDWAAVVTQVPEPATCMLAAPGPAGPGVLGLATAVETIGVPKKDLA